MKTRRTPVEFLVLEHHSGTSEFLSSYLEEKKHTCHRLHDLSGVEGWMNHNRPEVAIMDLSTSHVDGNTMISRLRAVDAGMPIVVLTARGFDEQLMHAALRVGANGYVSKHLPADQMYCVLARVLAAARHYARRARPRKELLGAA